MKKKWHHYLKWEDYQAGMYRTLSGEAKALALQDAIEFTGNAELYGDWMLHVVERWPICCEHNLTERGMNRQAWIGHAAACMARGLPEDITRAAWSQLTDKQRDDANAKADLAIQLWEMIYEEQNSKVHRQMDEARIRGRAA
jgi:hypothetical protein